MICSRARFDIDESEKKKPDFKYADCTVVGDSPEAALVKFYQPIENI